MKSILKHTQWLKQAMHQLSHWFSFTEIRAIENRKLGAFGVHLFGQVPARLVTDKPPIFPILDWLQFRELKRLYSREAAAANKAAKADYANAWREYEESFPLESQLETLEAQLSKIDAERQSLADKAAKLKAAL